MSLRGLILPDAIAGGVAAFVGWVLAECLQGAAGRWYSVALTCGLVGGAIGVGLNLVAGMSHAPWKRQAHRVLPGLIIGGLAGAIGGSLDSLVFRALHWNLAVGWMVMGAGLGSVAGLYERSPAGLRSGLIGGLIGGLLFHPLVSLLSSLSGAGGRATAFVVLGGCVGVMIGVAKVVFAEAWLMVIEGDRPGRRLVLAAPTVVLGRGDNAALTFPGRGAIGVDEEHARIIRLSDGRFALEDNHSRHGTSVNLQRVLDRVVLKDGDMIRIGANSIRFRDRRERSPRNGVPVAPAVPPTPQAAPAPVAATPVQAGATAPSKPVQPPPRGLSPCPKCQRLVPGTRPYCVVCKLSF